MSASIGIWPERFWKMTPFELSTCFTGAERRFEQQRTLAAWHACNIMNVWTKKKVTPKKLLGNKPGVISMEGFKSHAEFEAHAQTIRDKRDRGAL